MSVPARSQGRRALDRLTESRPSFHGATEPAIWQLGDSALAWLAGELPLGAQILETGCGWSTVVLSQLAERHITVSPVPIEHERIRRWCEDEGFALDVVEFVEQPSEQYLAMPGVQEPDSLDLVLIDGDHAFPVPAIDWYFSAPLLKVGGLMVLDDVSIRSCRIVADFLRTDTANWALRHRADEAAVFEKTGSAVHADGDWRRQPWNDVCPSLDSRLRRLKHHLRDAARFW